MAFTPSLQDTAKQLVPIYGNRVKKLYAGYLTATNPEHKRKLESAIHQLWLRAGLDDQLLLPPPEKKDLANGNDEFPIGMVMYGNRPYHPLSIKLEEYFSHSITLGRTGSGKTNLRLLQTIEAQKRYTEGVRWLAFDFKRTDRRLLAHKDFKGQLLLFTPGREESPFSVNPLQPPPGTTKKQWIPQLCELLCSAFFLGEGAEGWLLDSVDEAYKYNPNPTIKDVLTHVKAAPTSGIRELNWKTSTINRLRKLVYGPLSDVFLKEPFIAIEKLVSQNASISVDTIPTNIRTFLISYILQYLYLYRLSHSR